MTSMLNKKQFKDKIFDSATMSVKRELELREDLEKEEIKETQKEEIKRYLDAEKRN